MLSSKAFEKVARRVQEALPEGLDQLRSDFSRNLREAVSAALARMDLVTREEFDVQAEVLARTRERVAELTRQVAALEAALPASGERSTGAENEDA